jgi:hypothetical protein
VRIGSFGERRRRWIVVIGLAWCAVPGAPALADEVIDRVLATAAGHVIMASDVAAARELGLVSVESDPDPARTALSRLIDRALMLTEVDRYAPPEPHEETIAGALEALRARFPNRDLFASALRRTGLDETHVRERLRQDLRIAAYLDQRFAVAPPSDEEMDGIYRNDPARFTRAGLLLSLDEARPEIARALVEERRAARVEEWVAGLRRRAQVVALY